MLTEQLPEDAPLWLDPHDGWILHIFKLQLLRYLGLVDLHGNLHLLEPFAGGCGVTDNVLGGPPRNGV